MLLFITLNIQLILCPTVPGVILVNASCPSVIIIILSCDQTVSFRDLKSRG